MEITVSNVTQVNGEVLKGNWRSPMIVITATDNTVYIDNIPGAKHSNNNMAWYGYDNWNNMIGQTIEIEVTDEWGNPQNQTSNTANYNIWAKHPNVRMVNQIQ